MVDSTNKVQKTSGMVNDLQVFLMRADATRMAVNSTGCIFGGWGFFIAGNFVFFLLNKIKNN